jgi:hypothetical protein
MTLESKMLTELHGKQLVLDIASPYVILGTLTGSDEAFLNLEHADVHDLRDTTTTRENYVVDSKRYGIRVNRERVMVRLAEIVSLSVLDDVLI